VNNRAGLGYVILPVCVSRSELRGRAGPFDRICMERREEKQKEKKKKREIGGLLSVHLPESSGNYVVKYIQNVECGIGSHNYGGRIPV